MIESGVSSVSSVSIRHRSSPIILRLPDPKGVIGIHDGLLNADGLNAARQVVRSLKAKGAFEPGLIDDGQSTVLWFFNPMPTDHCVCQRERVALLLMIIGINKIDARTILLMCRIRVGVFKYGCGNERLLWKVNLTWHSRARETMAKLLLRRNRIPTPIWIQA